MSLRTLTLFLHKHHGAAPIVIIDEYDTPHPAGTCERFHDTSLMRNLFSGGLKDNPHLSYGFLTGILRVAKGKYLQRPEQPEDQLNFRRALQ